MNKSVSSSRLLILCAALAACSSLLVGGVPSGSLAAASTRNSHHAGLSARALVDMGEHGYVTWAQAARAAARSSTFPQYAATVTAGGSSYHYVMAGKNPAVKVSNASVAISTDLVPVIIKFPNGYTWDSSQTDSCDTTASPLSRVQKSPIFFNQSWTWGGTPIGTEQVTDAYQRADFWQYAQPSGINPTYGISLTPTTLSPVTIKVPSADTKFLTQKFSCGNHVIGAINKKWLDDYLQNKTLPSLATQGVTPSSLPVFVLHNVVEYESSFCCDWGYHDVDPHTMQTYVVATYNNSGKFNGFPDIAAFTHELAEWQNDPYLNNPTPPWGNIGQISGCAGTLEVGDPLTGKIFTDVFDGFTYHVQELAFFSWYYYQSPSLGVNGWYSDQDTFKKPAAACWDTAQEVPGTASLNTGGNAEIQSVSCGSAGNCSGGGTYKDGAGQQAFLVNEVNGRWGHAEEVPGTAALNTGANDGAQVTSVSCVSAGNCSAGGFYTDNSGQQAFVATGVNGTWGNAEEVPGTAALNTGGGAEIQSVSCTSAGNCSAGGFYVNSSGAQAFVVNEVNGAWGKAEEVPGTAALNASGYATAEITSVSCASAGNCSAGGNYSESSGVTQAFVVNEVNGTWGNAEEVPGTAALNTDGDAQISSISCASAGNCSAGGDYTDSSGLQVFVVPEVNGRWGHAEEVPGTAALNAGGDAAIASVSCGSAGNCSVGGYYGVSDNIYAFLVTEVNGTWDSAEEVAGAGALVDSVSCASAGNCSAGGDYKSNSGQQAFVANQVNGTWGQAEEVPGTAALNAGGGGRVTSVSCASSWNCSAGGFYVDKSGNLQVFAADLRNGT